MERLATGNVATWREQLIAGQPIAEKKATDERGLHRTVRELGDDFAAEDGRAIWEMELWRSFTSDRRKVGVTGGAAGWRAGPMAMNAVGRVCEQAECSGDSSM